jgi:hypothetical protein
MSDVTAVITTETSAQQMTGRRFVWWLLLAGVVPLPVFVLLFRPSSSGPGTQQAFMALFLMTVAHGGLSGLFWFDRRYRTYMAAWPRQYYWNIACLAVVSLIGVFTLGQRFVGFFSLGYIVWNLFHFGRQNWGILCLAALGTNTPKPTRIENLAGHIACVGGVIGLLSWQLTDSAYGVRQLGCVIMLTGLALSVVVACRQIISKTDPLRVLMTLSTGGFFLPIFLLGLVGVTAMGATHGAQYAIVMTVLANDRRQGPPWFRVAGMVAVAVLYLQLYVALTDPTIPTPWLLPAQVVSGLIVMWHYMIDAGLWRLRQPFQRNAVRESFPFLFATARPDEQAQKST